MISLRRNNPHLVRGAKTPLNRSAILCLEDMNDFEQRLVLMERVFVAALRFGQFAGQHVGGSHCERRTRSEVDPGFGTMG